VLTQPYYWLGSVALKQLNQMSLPEPEGAGKK